MSRNTDALDDRKSYATLAAQFALAGHELHRELGIDGVQRISVVRHGMSKQLPDLVATRALLHQIGGTYA